MTYATDTLLEEVAYVAWSYHWTLDAVMDLEHPDRERFLQSSERFRTAGDG